MIRSMNHYRPNTTGSKRYPCTPRCIPYRNHWEHIISATRRLVDRHDDGRYPVITDAGVLLSSFNLQAANGDCWSRDLLIAHWVQYRLRVNRLNSPSRKFKIHPMSRPKFTIILHPIVCPTVPTQPLQGLAAVINVRSRIH
jgi:hypothetical protein